MLFGLGNIKREYKNIWKEFYQIVKWYTFRLFFNSTFCIYVFKYVIY